MAANSIGFAKKNAGGRRPAFLVTDGLQSYKKTVNKEFKTKMKETEHIHKAGLLLKLNNNPVERLNGTIRDREKTMRGLKKEDTPIIDGHRLYYNFIKPHMSLDGQTPSERAGISINGNENKWLNLMRKAIEYRKGLEVIE